MIHRFDPSWGTHIPVLIKCLEKTKGPVLELGLGISSTPLLHALCEDQDRYLMSLDNDPTFIKMFDKYNTDRHPILMIDNWTIASGAWDVVLVDSKPESSRSELIKLHANSEYIIIHDSEPEHNELYHYDEIYPRFKYRYDYTKTKVHTTVLSNFHELNFLHNS
jgi:hypothetical protein